MLKASCFICITILALCWSALAEDYPKIQMLNGKVTIEFIPTPGEKYGKVTFPFNKPGKYTVRVSGSKDGASHNFLYLGELTIQDQKTPIYKKNWVHQLTRPKKTARPFWSIWILIST